MGRVHMLNYMHAITPNLTLGYCWAHIDQNGMNKWAYVGQYQWEKLKFFFQAIPFGPEKFVCGVQGKHGKRLDTYAELKIDQSD